VRKRADQRGRSRPAPSIACGLDRRQPIERHDDSRRRSVALERRQMDDGALRVGCDAFDAGPGSAYEDESAVADGGVQRLRR